MNLSKVRCLLGPPGTGKTTELLRRIEVLLAAGVRPDEIAFVTFTKRMATEATDRAVKRFDLDPEAFPWFKTIHAMAFRAMGEKCDVMGSKDWAAFGETCSYEFSDSVIGEEMLNFEEDGDCLRSVDQLARVMRAPIDAAIDHAGDVPPHLVPEMFATFARRLTAWKSDNRKIDFVDMLERALVTAWRPPVRFAFVDEAQDNSRIQNSLIRHWFIENSRCELVTYAGDDDQQINTWAGAQGGALQWIAEHAGALEILGQSWRVPRAAHGLAEAIIRQNVNRVAKTYAPRDHQGRLLFANDAAQALSQLAAGDTLALVRNVVFAKGLRESCLSAGLLFHGEVGGGSPLDRKDSRGAFNAISSWRRDVAASAAEFKSLLEFIPSNSHATRLLPVGTKKRAKENRDPVPLWRARDEFKLGGLLDRFVGPHPFDALVKLEPDERHYLSVVHARDPLLAGFFVNITSIHRAKGREAVNVILQPNLAKRTARRRDTSALGLHEENCCAYVAATRPRDSLIILDPSSRLFYDYGRLARVA